MKHRHSLFSAFVLAAGLLIAFTCSTASAQTKPIELTFSSLLPPMAPVSQLHKRWGEMIEQKSGGKVKFTWYFGGALLKQMGGETIRGVQSGVVDIGYNPISERYGFVLNGFTELPFLGWTSMSQAASVYEDLFRKYPALRDEFKGVRVYAPKPMPASQISTAKRPVRLPADLKGMKLHGGTGVTSRYVAAIGGNPVEMTIGEWYTSLNSGLIEGIIAHEPAINIVKCTPLVPYHTKFGGGGVSFMYDAFFINPSSFSKLPSDVQKIFNDLEPWFIEESLKLNEEEIQRAIGEAKKLNQTIINLTRAEIQQWADLAKPIHDKWIADMQAKGLPGKAIYEDAKRLIGKK